MVEYIEREALMKELSESTEPFNTGSVFRAIRKQPAADVAPVPQYRGMQMLVGPAFLNCFYYKFWATVNNQLSLILKYNKKIGG